MFEKKKKTIPLATLYSNILGLCDIVLILAGLGQQTTSRQDQSADDSVSVSFNSFLCKEQLTNRGLFPACIGLQIKVKKILVN